MYIYMYIYILYIYIYIYIYVYICMYILYVYCIYGRRLQPAAHRSSVVNPSSCTSTVQRSASGCEVAGPPTTGRAMAMSVRSGTMRAPVWSIATRRVARTPQSSKATVRTLCSVTALAPLAASQIITSSSSPDASQCVSLLEAEVGGGVNPRSIGV